MSKITLNFLSEEVLVHLPKTFSELRNKIAFFFQLNLEDVNNVILSYIDIEAKESFIKNENDYKAFLSKKAEKTKIYLDINQKEEKEILNQREIDKNKVKLEELLKKDYEMEKPCPGKFKIEEDELKEINDQISKLKQRRNELIKKIHSSVKEKNDKHTKIRKEIAELQKKLGLPVKYNFFKRVGPFRVRVKENENVKNCQIANISPLIKDKKEVESKKNIINISTDNPKKEENKKIINKIPKNAENEKNGQEIKKIHIGYLCDGCNSKIFGIRYKCAVCDDFDYCENCEKKMGLKHGHPLLKIKDPERTPIYFKCVLEENKE